MISVIRSGFDAALKDIDVTSNNIANAKTTGFKKRQATFADVYGNTNSIAVQGARVGLGATLAENRIWNQQGALQQTGAVLDLAIEGSGMFNLIDPARPDQSFYTRDGSFFVNSDGLISNNEGMELMSSLGQNITVPMVANETALTGVAIGNNGIVQASYGTSQVFAVGQIGLASFADSNRLTAVGQNLFKANVSSGQGVLGEPVSDGRGKVHSGALEMSNIDMTSELTTLMRAQQAFSGSSRLLQAQTEMARKFTQ